MLLVFWEGTEEGSVSLLEKESLGEKNSWSRNTVEADLRFHGTARKFQWNSSFALNPAAADAYHRIFSKHAGFLVLIFQENIIHVNVTMLAPIPAMKALIDWLILIQFATNLKRPELPTLCSPLNMHS